jgi:hypothetical protein
LVLFGLIVTFAAFLAWRHYRSQRGDSLGSARLAIFGFTCSILTWRRASCHAPENGVGVKELSRLISRLRHRQFGILVTTSFLGHQAYQELRSDRHTQLW